MSVGFIAAKDIMFIAEPLNELTRSLESGGILASWSTNRNRYLVSLGKRKAQQNTIRGSISSSEDSKQDSIVALLVQLIIVGLGVSAGAFLAEVATKATSSPMCLQFLALRRLFYWNDMHTPVF